LVTGTITEFGDSVRISAKVLDTATAQIHAAVRSGIPKTDAIKELLGRGVDTGIERGRPQGPLLPLKRSAIQSQQTQEVEEFSFQLQRCNVDGADIVCHWAITNKNPEDREISEYARCQTVLYDNLGREYLPSRWEIGGSSSSERTRVIKTLLSGVPTPASIRFKLAGSAGYHDSSRSFDSITAVKVSFYLGDVHGSVSGRISFGGSCFDVTFRDIPLRAR
jgi:hypothetical protein